MRSHAPIVASCAALSFAPRFVSAVLFGNPLGPGNRSLLGVVCNVRDGLFPILMAMGIIAFIVAGYLYFAAGGDAARVSAAKKAFIAAVIGVALAILSLGLPSIIASLFDVAEKDLPAACQ